MYVPDNVFPLYKYRIETFNLVLHYNLQGFQEIDPNESK